MSNRPPLSRCAVTMIVRPGDSVPSLAYEQGRFWEDVWNHPKNSSLRELRKNPNILCEGDELFIPPLETKSVPVEAGKLHRFRLRGVPSVLRVRLIEPPNPLDDPMARILRQQSGSDIAEKEERPWAGVRYRLEVDGRVTEGNADQEGVVSVNIAPNAQSAHLTVAPGTSQEATHILRIGHIHPIEGLQGCRERLRNLGYPCSDAPEDQDGSFAAAVRRFQQDEGLEVTGELDESTRTRIGELHGS